MPNWKEVLDEIVEVERNPDKYGLNENNGSLDVVRRKYLASVSQKTGRNVIAYYSSFLQRLVEDAAVNDKDISGFMLAIHGMDRSKGLDLILHTPGGDIAATEAIVHYLHKMFEKDIRVIVPQISMSAGTMIALSANEIMMGTHSNLGPIDPQFNGFPAQAILKEFDMAIKAIEETPAAIPLWQSIIGKLQPTFIVGCENAIDWSYNMVKEWLAENMLQDSSEEEIKKVMHTFSSHDENKTHNRHIPRIKCEEVGLNISHLEEYNDLQDAILTTHHAFMHTFSNSHCSKIIENQFGVAYIEKVQA